MVITESSKYAQEENEMIVAGTGHRPDKLGGYDDAVMLRVLKLAFDWLDENKPDHVISGGALGWDQQLANAAKTLEIPYTMALPFEGFEDRWQARDKKRLANLIKSATQVCYICDPGYAGWKMQKRNEWMVDNCDTILALWNGTSGGTGNCISYANKKGKPIINLWEKYNET